MNNNLESFLPVRRAALLAGVTAPTIREWIKTGRLPAVRLVGRLRVRLADLEALAVSVVVARVPSPAVPRNPDHVSASEAAKIVGVSRRTIRSWMNRGRLARVEASGRPRFSLAAVRVLASAISRRRMSARLAASIPEGSFEDLAKTYDKEEPLR